MNSERVDEVSDDIELVIYMHFNGKDYMSLSETIFDRFFLMNTNFHVYRLEDNVFYYLEMRQGIFALLGNKNVEHSPISKIPHDLVRMLMKFLPEKY